MPLFLPGCTGCNLCWLILRGDENMVGVSPCIPESTVEAAALLMPDDYVDWENRERIRLKLREVTEAKYGVITGGFLGGQKGHDEFLSDYLPDKTTTKEDILWHTCDVLMHRECFENSPIRGAIAFLRGEHTVFVVRTDGGGITNDEGKTILTDEQICDIIEEHSE